LIILTPIYYRSADRNFLTAPLLSKGGGNDILKPGCKPALKNWGDFAPEGKKNPY